MVRISGGFASHQFGYPGCLQGPLTRPITSLDVCPPWETPGSAFSRRQPTDLALEGGRIFLKAEGVAKGVLHSAMCFRRANVRLVTGSWAVLKQTAFSSNPKLSTHSFGCHFVEVHVASQRFARLPR